MSKEWIKTVFPMIFTALLLGACQTGIFSPNSIKLIDDGKSECVVVYDQTRPTEKFAVKELKEIIKGTTGVDLKAVDLNSTEAKTAKKRIVLGRNKLTRELVDNDLIKSLKDQESLVTGRGNDLILTGGDDWGMIYAVYDFVENEAGYRCYAPYPGGEYFRKSNTLVYSGKETRTIPEFPGFRICYTSSLMIREHIRDFARFSFRNRGTRLDWEKYGKGSSFANDIGLKEKYKLHVPGHALFYYVPAYDKTWCFWKGSGKPALKGSFKEHPEYFTLNKKGKRVDNAQLCFSNPELRKLFTERVIEAVKVKGPGVYMVGSNDNHGGTYCFCPECLKLQEKYNCTGGPLWDYLLELCATLKKDYPDVYITSLAYKGAKQTEIAPDNIKFPENFICDAAILKSDRTLKESKPVKLSGGIIVNNFNRYENLKKWVSLTDHVSYWYYGGAAPYQIYKRMQEEFKELHAAGVKSVGSCGLGSMEFGDLTTYLYFRLLVNPDLDTKKVVKEFCDFKFGAAAPMMIAIIEELEKMRRDNLNDRAKSMFCDDTYDKMTFIEAEQLVRWRKDFDKMMELVRDDPIRARNVRIVRTALDCWTIINMPKIRMEFPDEKIDIKEVIDQGLASSDEAIKAGISKKRFQSSKRVLNDMSLYANLKDDSLPVELQKYPEEKVIRYLPVSPRSWSKKRAALSKDTDAVSGWTMREKVEKSKNGKNGCKIEFYDAFERQWLKMMRLQQNKIVPGKYKLYYLFTAKLPARNRLVFHHLWGSSLDIMKLGRYYDPSYHERQYEYWANLKFEGPLFDPKSKDKDSYISCDQVFLVNKGKKKE